MQKGAGGACQFAREEQPAPIEAVLDQHGRLLFAPDCIAAEALRQWSGVWEVSTAGGVHFGQALGAAVDLDFDGLDGVRLCWAVLGGIGLVWIVLYWMGVLFVGLG